jgi:hypothetical protein
MMAEQCPQTTRYLPFGAQMPYIVSCEYAAGHPGDHHGYAGRVEFLWATPHSEEPEPDVPEPHLQTGSADD